MDTVTVVLLIVLAAMGAVFAVAARRETARDRARRDRSRAGEVASAEPATNPPQS